MYWDIVEKIVSQRGKQVKKYTFFENVWKVIEDNSPLIIVRAPTGCGKTESVTVPFFHNILTNSRNWFSLVYALPSRALVAAMKQRLLKSLTSLGVAYATVTSNYGEPLTLSPFLEGDIAVSTYDTLIFAFYGVRRPGYHVLLPLSKIVGSLVVLDEVQLVQDTFWYSMSILPAHMANLVRLGAQVVLMSATIPTVLMDEIEREVCETAKPVEVVSRDRPLRGRLEVEIKEGILPSNEELDRLVKENILCCEKLPALIVVNTVEKAVNIYKRLLALKRNGKIDDIEPLLLHSRLSLGERTRVERLFEEWKEVARLDKAIVVATQVIEAGLDLNVRYLLTELSPIDSLIQRLGRAARWSDGEAVIYLDPDGGKNVYPAILLERSLQMVKGDGANLPEAVSNVETSQNLVDSVYTRDVVEKLSESVKTLVMKAKCYIHQFLYKLYSSDTRENFSELPLLRLGYEMLCLYLSGECYKRLLELTPLIMETDEVRRSIVRVSCKEVRAPPHCIVHGGDVLIVVKVVSSWENEDTKMVRLEPMIVKKGENLHELVEKKDILFLLNPEFYEVYENRELGVVRPWVRV
jgi:CRISPR-associated endonuclease/helicase Cas3